jgi:antitoxin component YwqK of YwqJK toxin-antitoxin module
MIQRIFHLLILLHFTSYSQSVAQEYQGEVNYKDVTEIKGLIYIKADTSLVTGKVVRYNRKNEARSYILVTKGKPDILGWIQISDDYARPKESVLGEVVKGAAIVTGAVMAATGSDLNIPYQGKTNELTGNEIKSFHNVQKDYVNKAYDEMSDRNDISKNLESTNNSEVRENPRDGFYKYNHENGQLKSVENYRDGKKSGVWEIYYSNGKLERKGNYIEGKKDGIWDEYYRNGQLLGRINYKMGKEQEVIEVYYKNSQLMMKGQFQDGKQIGEWKYYDENGELTKTENFDN